MILYNHLRYTCTDHLKGCPIVVQCTSPAGLDDVEHIMFRACKIQSAVAHNGHRYGRS